MPAQPPLWGPTVRIVKWGHSYIGRVVKEYRTTALVQFRTRDGKVRQARVKIVRTREEQNKLSCATVLIPLAPALTAN